jgi:hypothetical protein
LVVIDRGTALIVSVRGFSTVSDVASRNMKMGVVLLVSVGVPWINPFAVLNVRPGGSDEPLLRPHV